MDVLFTLAMLLDFIQIFFILFKTKVYICVNGNIFDRINMNKISTFILFKTQNKMKYAITPAKKVSGIHLETLENGLYI